MMGWGWAWGVTPRYSTGPTCMRPWVPLPALHLSIHCGRDKMTTDRIKRLRKAEGKTGPKIKTEAITPEKEITSSPEVEREEK